MITIRIRGPQGEGAVCSHGQAEYPIAKPRVWIGRGEDVLEKEGAHGYALNLAAYSKAVSRLHACLLFSPGFFRSEGGNTSFLEKLGGGWSTVGQHARRLIWEFARAGKRVMLRDLQSKAGVFRKVERERVCAGMTVVLGDSRPLTVHNREIYDSPFALTMRLEQLTQQGFLTLNGGTGQPPTSFWLLSYRQTNYLLLDCPSPRILIGRSSDAHLVLPDPAVSRRHASLTFQDGEWLLCDGDGAHPSSNGVWVRTRRVWLSQGETVRCKVGDVLLGVTLRGASEECTSLNRSTEGSLQEPRKEELEESPALEKHCSQL